MDLSKKIIDTINKEKIKPTSKWIFDARNFLFWIVGIIFIVIGSISVSLIAYNILNQDWDIYTYYNKSFLGFVIATLPYLWIFILIIFIYFAFLNIKNSKKGYKYSSLIIIGSMLVLSISIGLILNNLDISSAIDNYLGSNIKSYQSVEVEKQNNWTNPDRGLFSGKIVTKNNNFIEITDFTGKFWQVDISHAQIKGNISLNLQDQIKIIGLRVNDDTIDAFEIRPWGKGSQGLHGNKPNSKGNNQDNGLE